MLDRVETLDARARLKNKKETMEARMRAVLEAVAEFLSKHGAAEEAASASAYT